MAVGDIIKDFAAPGVSLSDLAWDGKTLWHCDYGASRIHQIDPITGRPDKPRKREG